MRKVKNVTSNTESILGDLWEDSVFNGRSFNALEKLASNVKDISNIIPSEVYYTLSTSRNRNLISQSEQDCLRDTTVGFFGLSVGSHGAITWVMESRANVVKLCDPDVVSATNLNRLRFGWDTIGKYKTNVVEDVINAISPTTTVFKTTDTDFKTVEHLFNSTPTLDVVVDAIDDMKGKIFLRNLCKVNNVPLISAADVGDNVVLDIERYDLKPQPQPFLGRIPDIEKIDFDNLSDMDRRKLIINLVGFEENSESLLSSLLVLGKELGTWPQLAATATMAGGIIATTIKKIKLGEQVKSGRYYISLDSILVADYSSEERISKRKEYITRVKEKFAL